MLSCILRSPLQVAFSQAVKHDLSGCLLTCLVALGQKCTIVCTGAERSSPWRRCRLRWRFPFCFRQMQQSCHCDDISLSLNVCPINVLMTWYILYLYHFTLNKSCLSHVWVWVWVWVWVIISTKVLIMTQTQTQTQTWFIQRKIFIIVHLHFINLSYHHPHYVFYHTQDLVNLERRLRRH